jgi:hypothetical protein
MDEWVRRILLLRFVGPRNISDLQGPVHLVTNTEAYGVYSAVIPRATRHVLPHLPKRFAMADETFPSTSHAGCFPDKYQGEFGEAFSNFEEVNKQPLRLLPEFHLPRRYDFVTKKQLDAMIKVIQPPPVLDPGTGRSRRGGNQQPSIAALCSPVVLSQANRPAFTITSNG